ncbi:MAG: hypothetical protein EBS66_19400 [Betaproteobacteria bacterium]|nr:hypothetical protein [Betaproteobacteria bacterium]
MVRIQLSTGYLDVKEDTSFPLNFQVGDIRDISKRQGNFSKTITLIGNNNNNTLLNHYYDVNIQAGTFNINTLTRCDVIQDGIPVMTNATLQLINIKKSQLTSAYEQMVEYEVLIKVINSFDHTVNNGYKYVMPFNIDNQYQFNWFKPAIYAQTYFDRIFSTSGYSYTWDGLEAANFDKLLIPYNGDQNIVDWNDAKVVANTTYSFTSQQAFSNLITPWTETSDPANLFSNGTYTTPQWVGVGSELMYHILI